MRKLVVTEMEVMSIMLENQENSGEDEMLWMTEAAIAEAAHGKHTQTARRRVKKVLRALRKKGLTERHNFPGGISWRLVNGADK